MEIKVCQCGSILLAVKHNENINEYYYVVCGICGDCGTLEDTREEAILSWNNGEKLNPRMKIFY